jgi:hypothetical protein
VLSCLLLNTVRSLRSTESFQRRSTALRAFASFVGEYILSFVRSERALASNLLEIEMAYGVGYPDEGCWKEVVCETRAEAETVFETVSEGRLYEFCEDSGWFLVLDVKEEPDTPYFDEDSPF